ncbi:ElyC/SanA/YdcF family protein [uncultured Capnocytophaga sp.]|jgi:sanA protein|uniref:SanA/YdcF family protein n=1 Tax=uncultured Capnocytophaga sp. TaxID=159273 RepID=UPI0026286033|nr:ElyC/SanA/YdcF family protein [uncultured Capnocytophaga sp.]
MARKIKLSKQFLRRSIYFLLFLFSMVIVVIHNADSTIRKASEEKCYTEIDSIPQNKVALLLGTSKTLKNGQSNLYFKYRVEAAVALFKAKKIDFILISGDNSRQDYDEPTDMKEALVDMGVPSDKIYLDYAGFRTLDSIIRAKEIFSLTELTIISQAFHNQRAIYLAQKYGIKAIGFNAKDVDKYSGFKTQVREYFARVKVFWDLTFGVQPKFLGEKIEIH